MVPPLSHRIPRVRQYSGFNSRSQFFKYVTLTLFSWPSHAIPLNLELLFVVLTLVILLYRVWPLPFSLATTHRISFDFFSSPYLDVSVQAVPLIKLFIHSMMTDLLSAGFFHSDIHVSLPAYGSSWLFAVRCVLLRLPVPRHPPCALFCLTSFLMYSVTLAFLLQWLYLSFGSSIAFFIFVLVCFFLSV